MVGSIATAGSALPVPVTTPAGGDADVPNKDLRAVLDELSTAVGSLQQVLAGTDLLGTSAGGPASIESAPPSKVAASVEAPPAKVATAVDAPPAKSAPSVGQVEQASAPGKAGPGSAKPGKGLAGLFDGLVGGIMGGIQGFIGGGGIDAAIGAATGVMGGGGDPVSSIIGGVSGFLGRGGMNAVMGGINGLLNGFKAGMGGGSVDQSETPEAGTATEAAVPPTAGSAGTLPAGAPDDGGMPPDPSMIAA